MLPNKYQYNPTKFSDNQLVEKSLLLVVTTSRSNFLIRGLQRRLLSLSDNSNWIAKLRVKNKNQEYSALTEFSDFFLFSVTSRSRPETLSVLRIIKSGLA